MLKLALGAIPYYWPREAVFKFYRAIAGTPVDIVYLGETVCSRRHELRLADWLDIANSLSEAGMQPVLSTMVLIESGQDLATLRRIAENGRFAVEANDLGAVHLLEGAPFIAGPHLNIYNRPTLDLFAGLGAIRWVMPLEMGRAGLADMLQDRPAGLETEVFAYGRMPLAFSARCFTARHRNLPKDNCEFSCLDHPDGLLLQTRENSDFLVLNGIQTQSAKVCNLVNELAAMQAMGVNAVRISPQAHHNERIIEVFDQVRHGRMAPTAAMTALEEWMPDQPCNGYWNGEPGMQQLEQALQFGEDR
jgi:collagenase-like PrtC family protease